MDSGSSCEVIYEHCFLKLKLSIRALRLDSKIPLIGFLGEHSWPLGEVPLEGIVWESPYTRTETLNFVIVRLEEREKKIKETVPEATKNILSCVGVEEKIIVNDKYPERTVVIGKQFPTSFKRKLTIMVKGKPFNTEHRLNEYNHIEPVKQKKRGLAPERNEAACKEMDELTKEGILQEVKYQTWVANPVMIPTEILLGCLQRLPSDTNGRGGRRQNSLFIGKGVFCYRKMPFGLKKAGATYQRLIDKVFNDQIGRNLEAYVKAMVIKSSSEEDMLMDIQETLDRLRSINIKLNPKKCSFGVEEGPLLGHLITK
ncbi:reverse transcriptase domain-containing protein [Tanacetum coccineum]